MTYVKLDDAIKAVKAIEVPLGGFYDKIDAWLKAIDIAADALAALPTVSDGWEDISSAPTNGTEILLYTDTSKSDAETQSYVEAICEGEHVKRIQMGYWCVLQGKWEKPIIGDPIFWRPLPDPPSE